MSSNRASFILMLSLLGSCVNNTEDSAELSDYINSYKKVVFYECVNAGTNRKLYEFSLNNGDLGYATEVSVIQHKEIENAKQIGIKLSSKIREIDFTDYEGRKPIFSDCLDFAFSNYVDSIARSKFNLYRDSNFNFK